MMNRVEYLLKNRFSCLSYEDKLTIKKLGPYQLVDYSHSVVDGKQRRKFNSGWFKKFRWLTVNKETNLFYCFNCLTFGDSSQDPKWCKEGFINLKNFADRASNHGNSAAHLNSTTRLSIFGTINIAAKVDSGYRVTIQRHNEAVTQNRNILEKIIEAIRFCGIHELALHGHNESEDSLNRGIFLDLIKLLSTLDSQLHHHLESSTVNKYITATIQNEIIDCMYEVYIDDVKENLRAARFVAVEADETTDITCRSQFVIILRYVEDCEPVERFLKFVEVHDRTGSGLAQVIMDELAPYQLHDKLIAQAYDGATVMSGNTRGVQAFVREKYPYAHYVHCYAHQTNLVLQKLTTNIPQVNLFFASLSAFSSFFSSSPKRMDTLREACNKSLPRTCETRWNFRSRVLHSVVNYKDQILDALFHIQVSSEWDHVSKQEALGLSKTLQESRFNYFLRFFNDVFVHTDILFCQFQNRQTTGIDVKNAIDNFTSVISNVRENLPQYEEPQEPGGKRRRATSPFADACEVCDILTTQLTDRLQRSDFLLALSIVDPKQFREKRISPSSQIDTIVKNYPMVSRQSLTTELEVLYSNESFHSQYTSTVSKLFSHLRKSELTDTFHEVSKVLEILLATPVHTAEPERVFSTLKRIKSFARNATSQNRLNSLTVLSVHKDVILKDARFNQKVIDKFAPQRERRVQFLYKNA